MAIGSHYVVTTRTSVLVPAAAGSQASSPQVKHTNAGCALGEGERRAIEVEALHESTRPPHDDLHEVRFLHGGADWGVTLGMRQLPAPWQQYLPVSQAVFVQCVGPQLYERTRCQAWPIIPGHPERAWVMLTDGSCVQARRIADNQYLTDPGLLGGARRGPDYTPCLVHENLVVNELDGTQGKPLVRTSLYVPQGMLEHGLDVLLNEPNQDVRDKWRNVLQEVWKNLPSLTWTQGRGGYAHGKVNMPERNPGWLDAYDVDVYFKDDGMGSPPSEIPSSCRVVYLRIGSGGEIGQSFVMHEDDWLHEVLRRSGVDARGDEIVWRIPGARKVVMFDTELNGRDQSLPDNVRKRLESEVGTQSELLLGEVVAGKAATAEISFSAKLRDQALRTLTDGGAWNHRLVEGLYKFNFRWGGALFEASYRVDGLDRSNDPVGYRVGSMSIRYGGHDVARWGSTIGDFRNIDTLSAVLDVLIREKTNGYGRGGLRTHGAKAKGLLDLGLVNRTWAHLSLAEAGLMRLHTEVRIPLEQFDLQLARFALPTTQWPASYTVVKRQVLTFEDITPKQSARAISLLGRSVNFWGARERGRPLNVTPPQVIDRFPALLAAAKALNTGVRPLALEGVLAVALTFALDDQLGAFRLVQEAANDLALGIEQATFAEVIGRELSVNGGLVHPDVFEQAMSQVQSIARGVHSPQALRAAARGWAGMIKAMIDVDDGRGDGFGYEAARQFKAFVTGLSPTVALDAMKIVADCVCDMDPTFPASATSLRTFIMDWGRQHSGEVLGDLLLGHERDLSSLEDPRDRFEDRDQSTAGNAVIAIAVDLERMLPQLPLSAQRLDLMKALFTAGTMAEEAPSWMNGLIGIATRQLFHLEPEHQQTYLKHVANELPNHPDVPRCQAVMLDALAPPRMATDSADQAAEVWDMAVAWESEMGATIANICRKAREG